MVSGWAAVAEGLERPSSKQKGPACAAAQSMCGSFPEHNTKPPNFPRSPNLTVTSVKPWSMSKPNPNPNLSKTMLKPNPNPIPNLSKICLNLTPIQPQ